MLFKKHLLFRLFVFFLPFLLCLVWAEWKLSLLPSDMKVVKEKFESEGANAQVLLLGTSHLGYGVVNSAFSVPTLNAALPVQSLTVSAQLGEKYISRMKNLKLVILSTSYFSRDYTHWGTHAATRLYDYFRLFGLRGDGDLRDFLDVRYYSQYFTLGREVALSLIRNGKEPIKQDEVHWELNEIGAEKEAAYHESLRSPSAKEVNLRALKHFAGVLKAHSIKLAIVTTPVTQFYLNALDQKQFQEVQNDIIAAAQGAEVLSKDYLRDPRFSLSDFYNVDHMTEGGRLKYTALLNEEIIRPALNWELTDTTYLK